MLDRPTAAGILFGLLIYKPQFGLMVPFVLAATGRWRAFAAAAATAALLVLVTFAVGVTVTWLWRSSASFALRAAALCLSAMLASSYGYDYDMMIVGPAIAFPASAVLGKDDACHALAGAHHDTQHRVCDIHSFRSASSS
jgi:Glycosyltransferase family 87